MEQQGKDERAWREFSLQRAEYDAAYQRHVERGREVLSGLSKLSGADLHQGSGMRAAGTQSIRLVVPAGRGRQGALWILSKLERHNLLQTPASQLSVSTGPRELFALGFAILWQGCLSSAARAKARLGI